MSENIRPQHLGRKAILYVRQSSPYQVTHNLESQKLQYAMEARLRQLGRHEIEVVDEDLGSSAAGCVTRAGFERMVAEVCLGKVGAVAAREVSRFARNSREWQQLVEVCRVVDYELDLLRQRSVGRSAQREGTPWRVDRVRADWLYQDRRSAPGKGPGFVRAAGDSSRVSQVLRVGYSALTLMWFLEHGLEVPTRTPRGEMRWKRPPCTARCIAC